MALQFNPYPTGPWERKQERDNPDFNQTVSQPILQGLGLLQRNQEMDIQRKRQAMLDEYLKSKEMRDTQQFNSEYGTPIDPNAMVGMPTGQMAQSSFMPGASPRGSMGPQIAPQPVGGSSPLIEQFNQWRAGGMSKESARPEYMPAMGKDDRKIFQDQFKPQPSYVIPGFDYSTGQPTGTFTPLPAGAKPVMAPRPAATQSPTIDKETQKAIVKSKMQLAEQRPMVQGVISEIERVEKLNENSMGGMVGAANMGIRSALNIGTDSEQFKNTSDVVNTMQSMVAKVLKSTFGGQLSDGEREYLNQVYGALPKLTPTERGIAMKNVKTMIQGKFTEAESKFNEMSSYGGQSSGFQNTLGFNGNSGGSGGKIRVRNRQTGQTGSISEKFFDPNKYERVQ